MTNASFVDSVANLIEKTLFKFPFRKSEGGVYYRIVNINKCISLYNYMKKHFEEGIIKDFLYFTQEGFETLKSYFQNFNLEECVKIERADEANLNIMNALSDYYKWFSKSLEEVEEECLKNPDSSFNKELAKHVKFLLDVKGERVLNLTFDDFEGLKKFVQIVYFLSQNLNDETISDLTFYYSLINSDMRNIIDLDVDKIKQIATTTAFMGWANCEKGDGESSHDFVDFTVFEREIDIEELLAYPEIKSVVVEYINSLHTPLNKISFKDLNLIVSLFVEDKEELAKIKKIYYNLVKKLFVNKAAHNL